MSEMQLTQKQAEAIELLKNGARQILLYGGARSGKTIVFLMALIYRACRYPGSRHLAARLRNVHARTTIWHESLLPLLRQTAEVPYTLHRGDLFVEFENGSEIWAGGFDDQDRTEKLLGHEYATIYFNEVSQLNYDTITLGLSRLAQKIEGLTNKAFFDCNPPSPLHWAHKLFIEAVDPKSGEPLARPELYGHMKMNPHDNVENLPDDYIANFLETLPERARRRLLRGEWVKAEGAVYDRFDESMIIGVEDVPECEYYSVGLDFGLHMASVLVGWHGEDVYVLADLGGFNYTSSQFNVKMTGEWGDKEWIAYCDPSGGERLQEINASQEAVNSVEPGIDFINGKIERGQFFVVDTCRGVLDEISDYGRDEKERIVKENDHYMDGMRYGVFSPAQLGVISAGWL